MDSGAYLQQDEQPNITILTRSTCFKPTQLQNEYHVSWSDAVATIFSLFIFLFKGSFYSRVVFIPLESPQTTTAAAIRYVQTINAVWLFDAVSSTQSFSPAVSHGNESYNTNIPGTSLLIVVRNSLAVRNSQGTRLRMHYVYCRTGFNCVV